jgi:hypothetical protein
VATAGDGAAVRVRFGVVLLVVTPTGPSLDRWLAHSQIFGSVHCPFRLVGTRFCVSHVGRTLYGVIVLSIAYITHNSFRATATMARLAPLRLLIRSQICLAQGFWESWRERIPRGRIDQVVPAELSRPKTRGAEIDGKAQRGTRY